MKKNREVEAGRPTEDGTERGLEQKTSGVIGEGEWGPLKHESGVPMVVVRFGTAVFGTTKFRCPVGGPGVPDPARPWQTDCYYFFL